MKKPVVLVSCLSITFAFFSLNYYPASALPQGRAAGGQRKVILLHQNNTDMGLMDVYITDDAIRVVSLRNGFELLCRAPNWDVHTFRRSEKLEWIQPLKRFDGLQLGNSTADARKNTEVFVPRRKGMTAGLDSIRFVPRSASRTYIDGCPSISIRAEGLDFLSRFYRCPDTHTVPLTISTDRGKRSLTVGQTSDIRMDMGSDLRSGEVIEVSTKSWKKIDYKSADFAQPERFKRTMVSTQVTISPNLKKQIDDMFQIGPGFRGELH